MTKEGNVVEEVNLWVYYQNKVRVCGCVWDCVWVGVGDGIYVIYVRMLFGFPSYLIHVSWTSLKGCLRASNI